MQIPEGVNCLGRQLRRITHSSICIILHIIRNRSSNNCQLFIEKIAFQKWVLRHLFVDCVLLFSGPLYKTTCYGGDWVHSCCAVLKILLCARDFQELADFSQSFRRIRDYFHAWYVNNAAWKSFLGFVTSLSHTKIIFYFPFKFFRGINLPTQISKKCFY